MRKLLLLTCGILAPSVAFANPDSTSPITLNLDVLDTLRSPGNAPSPDRPISPGVATMTPEAPMKVVIVPKPADGQAAAAPAPVPAPAAVTTTTTTVTTVQPAYVIVPATGQPGPAASVPLENMQPLVMPVPDNLRTTAPDTSPVPGSVASAPSAIFAPSGYVQAGGNYYNVNHDLGNWVGEYVKGEVQTDPDNRWNGELIHEHEFKDDGEYGDIGNTHVFNEDWYSVISLGGGVSDDFLPKWRGDAFINRKWLDQRQLITTLGIGGDKAQDSHRDESVFAGATYYFEEPWIVQGGMRYNVSNPDSVDSLSEFIAVTQGHDKDYLVTLRYGYGKEAYQILGDDQILSAFYSQDVSLELRKWLNPEWGFDVRGEEYHNPHYNRFGAEAGVFREF